MRLSWHCFFLIAPLIQLGFSFCIDANYYCDVINRHQADPIPHHQRMFYLHAVGKAAIIRTPHEQMDKGTRCASDSMENGGNQFPMTVMKPSLHHNDQDNSVGNSLGRQERLV